MHQGNQDEVMDEDNSKWYTWVQIKSTIQPPEWKPKQVLYTDQGHPIEWGLGAKIEFKPQLDKENEIGYHRCTYYHQKIELEAFISFSHKFDHADLRFCYIPKSTTEEEAYLQSSIHDEECFLVDHSTHDAGYTPYVWMFDICLVKMTFRDVKDQTQKITKKFHLDSATGTCGCKAEEHLSSYQDELAHFKKSQFLSELELERVIDYAISYQDCSFAPVDIEFTARLDLRQMYKNCPILEYDENCILHSSTDTPTKLFQSKTLAAPAMNPFSPESQVKPKFFEKDTDVTFQIRSATSTTRAHAHSWILTAQSPVFCKMLSTEMLEKKSGVIKLEDNTSSESLQLFLAYLYDKTGWRYPMDNDQQAVNYRSVAKWNAKISFPILQLAHKYQVQDLTAFCIDNIISRPDSEFTMELAVKIFKAGKLYESDDLLQRSAEWIKRQTPETKMKLKTYLKKDSRDSICDFFLYLI